MTDEAQILDELPGVAYQAASEPSRPLLYVSAGAAALLGRTPEELLTDPPTSLDSLVHPDDRGWLAGQIRRALRSESVLDLRYRILMPDGDARWVWDRGRITPSENAPSVLTGFLMDASTLRLLARREVSGARRQALGELTGAFAHRFNNLLSAVMGPVELALASTSGDPELRRDLVVARDAVEQAASLTTRLGAFSQRHIGKAEVVRVNDVVRGFEEMVHELLRPKIRVMVHLSPDAPSVRMDPQHLEQVMINLVLNARDAMPDGGRLVISTHSRRLVEGDLRRDDELEPGSYAELKVVDGGEGIPEELRGRVFEPFFSTRPGHAGLGLSTVYGIVRQMGGVVRVGTSTEGGAAVSVLLPVAEAGEGAGVAGKGVGEGDVRILVVDDEEAVLEVMVRALRRRGYTVQGVPDESSALAAAESWGDRVDLVVLDVMLNGTTGPRLAHALARRMGPVPVLFTSAFVDDDQLTDFGIPESAVFLPKPFTLQALSDAVEEALAGAAWDAADDSTPGENSSADAEAG